MNNKNKILQITFWKFFSYPLCLKLISKGALQGVGQRSIMKNEKKVFNLIPLIILMPLNRDRAISDPLDMMIDISDLYLNTI